MSSGSPREMFRSLPWPYAEGRFPAALGAVVQKSVLTGSEPIRVVVHDADGEWAVGDGRNDPNADGACIATHITHVVELDVSIASLASMPPGHEASRKRVSRKWVIRPFRY